MNSQEQDKEKEVTIKVMKDGPLVIQGPITLTYANGTESRKMAFASLCRCGESNNMPFCDGYHRKAGFCSET
ncbi:MAG: CDGSH iron-sulfur domain-containing protein [Bacteroidota bacterium]|nr:CDGSH iron-sulfur domain-containing protein [Bacteroidota bacterium]